MDLQIRQANIDDVEAIREGIRSVAHYFLRKPTGKHAAAFFKTISVEAISACITDASFLYLVAEVEGCLAGGLAIKNNSHIYHLFVAEKFQKRGIASALWVRGRDMALAAGNPGCFTLNSTPHAVPVYRRFGFKPTGQKLYKYGVDFVPMEMEIRPRHG